MPKNEARLNRVNEELKKITRNKQQETKKETSYKKQKRTKIQEANKNQKSKKQETRTLLLKGGQKIEKITLIAFNNEQSEDLLAYCLVLI